MFYKVPLALGPTKPGYHQLFSLAIAVSLVTRIHFWHSWDGHQGVSCQLTIGRVQRCHEMSPFTKAFWSHLVSIEICYCLLVDNSSCVLRPSFGVSDLVQQWAPFCEDKYFMAGEACSVESWQVLWLCHFLLKFYIFLHGQPQPPKEDVAFAHMIYAHVQT